MRIPENREPTTPGELVAEFMELLGLTQAGLAKTMGITQHTLREILDGRRAVTPEFALLLSKAFGTTPDFWLNGQLALDLYRAQHDTDTAC